MKDRQEIAFKSLNNALKHDKLSHGFLFEGPKSSSKMEYAYALAKAICLQEKELDFKKDNLYQRIVDNKYHDILIIDGDKETIKKEDIENLFERFKYAGLEMNSKKVYIINNINNASTKVLNMLLKFMEEPSSKSCYGIFITDDVDNLLETIKSRLLRILFKKQDVDLTFFLNQNLDEKNARLASLIYDDKKEKFSLEQFEIIIDMFDNFIHKLNNLDDFIVEVFSRYYNLLKKYERDDCIFILVSFISLILKALYEDEYSCFLKEIKNKAKIAEILIDTKSNMNGIFDYKLVFDTCLFKIRSVFNGIVY